MGIATLVGCGITTSSFTRSATSNQIPHRPDSLPEDTIDFVRDVRPILSSKCFACHGPDAAARKAGLSLVDFEAATLELDPGIAAIVPGELEASELWRRINDSSDPMPPEETHDPLTEAEIDILGRWIRSGASYEPHWAYQVPRKHSRSTPGDPIDDLLRQRHRELGLTASDPADPITLYRRLALDITGIPPRPAEIDAFVEDSTPERLVRAVDRMLATPEFGERLAVLWLDLVRYADTVGYHGDQEHRIWPYRDWVIRAFNDGMPFDDFTRMQLAGDLIVRDHGDLTARQTQDALVASGYNRLLQTSHEGGLQLAEYRAIYMADRVRNASEVWMGATLGCAQCHDHKYDPYTHLDFHTFGAFFADIDDEEHIRNPYNGYNTTPTRREPEMRVVTPVAGVRLAALDRRRREAQDALLAAESTLAEDDPAWDAAFQAAIAIGGDRRETWVDDVLATGGTAQGDWRFHPDPDPPAHSGTSYRIQTSAGLVQHYTVETDRRIEVEAGSVLQAWVHLDSEDPPRAVMLQVHADGSWEHRAIWGDDSIVYGRNDGDTPSYRRRGELPPTGLWHRLEIPLSELGFRAGARIDGMAFTQFAGTVRWDAASIVHPGPAPTRVIEAARRSADERTAEDRSIIAEHRRASDPEIVAARASLERIRTERRDLESELPLTLYTNALETPRPVRVLPRGDWLDESGPLVEPAVPGFLGTCSSRHAEGTRPDRLDLANWLLSPSDEGGVGEMTSRVFVNRIWSMLFGEGLCPSEDDFGGQGRPPTHPEILDLLALDFMDSDWDIKALVRRLVLTEAYARSSIPASQAATLDPENLQFARQSRHRLAAEFVRDAALHAGGLLDRRQGGPSIKPPQPEGHYRHLNFPTRRYQPDTGEDQWRRGVYVHWQRQFLHPMMKAFDAPNREACTASRSVSNTPLAALVLLNDPVFVQAARGLAGRVLELDSNDHDRIVAAWRIVLGRHPRAAEIQVLATLLQQARVDFGSAPERAAALLAVDTQPGRWVPPAGITSVEIAAWTQTCRAILNLHETYTRD